jgi:PPOX class probable F420-dependent enzyme
MVHLTPQAKALLDGKNFPCVATLMPDGSPQVAPVWAERDGDDIIINATVRRQRYRNLKRDPRVALTVFDMSNPYSKVIIFGRAVEITTKGGEAHIDKLAMKYRGSKYELHKPEEPRVIIRIRPERIAT